MWRLVVLQSERREADVVQIYGSHHGAGCRRGRSTVGGLGFQVDRHPRRFEHDLSWSSGDRLNLARGAGVLKGAIDASMTAGAGNSLEKMLCHQLAAVHRAAMQLISPKMTSSIWGCGD
jgi:hypothetical protein